MFRIAAAVLAVAGVFGVLGLGWLSLTDWKWLIGVAGSLWFTTVFGLAAVTGRSPIPEDRPSDEQSLDT